MHHSQPVGHSPQRTSSPVFFTGCTNAMPQLCKLQSESSKTLSPKDYEKLKHSVSALFSKELLSPTLSVKGTSSVRHALLPSPKYSNSSEDVHPSSDEPVCSYTSPNSFEDQREPKSRRKPLLELPEETALSPKSSETAGPFPATLPFRDNAEFFLDQPNLQESPTSRVSDDESFRKRDRKHKRRRRMTTVPDLPNKRFKLSPLGSRFRCDTWEQLTEDIWQLYFNNKQTQAVYDMKMTLRDQLHNVVLDTFPCCGLYVVGSSMTGLGANSSDVDMCLMLSHSEIDQVEEATEILKVVYDIFSRYDFVTNTELIPAKVPILRFRDSVSAIEVDLNVNNAVGIRNTQLLSSYARIDNRVPPLVLLTKMWARCHGINDAKNHTLSSYSLVLMVIHYLQCGCRPPVLPCLQNLQPDKFNPYSDVRSLKLLEDLPPYTSENNESLSYLFLGFLNYFGNEFDYSNNVMSVRTGGIITKLSAMNKVCPKNKRAHWKYICIEEPFSLTNTACAVFKDSAFFYVRDVFLRSWNVLRSSGNLQSILDMNSIKYK